MGALIPCPLVRMNLLKVDTLPVPRGARLIGWTSEWTPRKSRGPVLSMKPPPAMSDTRHNPDKPMTRIVERNIQALIARRRGEEERRSVQDRTADIVTRFTGSMLFVYLHLALFGTWIVFNLPWMPTPKFDPSFVTLAMFASVEAIFLSTFVLITQNRMSALAEKRAELDLQVSLLTEHEVTKLIDLVTAIAARMELDEASNPELSDLKRDVQPEKVLDTIEHHTGSDGV